MYPKVKYTTRWITLLALLALAVLAGGVVAGSVLHSPAGDIRVSPVVARDAAAVAPLREPHVRPLTRPASRSRPLALPPRPRPVRRVVVVQAAPQPVVRTSGFSALELRIRHCESGDNYTAQNRYSTASGAWQFLDSTWDGFGGYSRAMYAPPAVQDRKARITFDTEGTTPWNASRACWG